MRGLDDDSRELEAVGVTAPEPERHDVERLALRAPSLLHPKRRRPDDDHFRAAVEPLCVSLVAEGILRGAVSRGPELGDVHDLLAPAQNSEEVVENEADGTLDGLHEGGLRRRLICRIVLVDIIHEPFDLDRIIAFSSRVEHAAPFLWGPAVDGREGRGAVGLWGPGWLLLLLLLLLLRRKPYRHARDRCRIKSQHGIFQ